MQQIDNKIKIRGRPRKTEEQKSNKTMTDYYNEYKKDKIECSCGKSIYKYNYEKHLETNNHKLKSKIHEMESQLLKSTS